MMRHVIWVAAATNAASWDTSKSAAGYAASIRSKATVEDIGVDLRLLENAFASSHAGMEDVGEAMMSAYFEGVRDPDAVRKKLEDIRNRGRYT